MEKKQIFATVSTVIILLLAIVCLSPFLLLIMSSFSENTSLIRDGYSFFPKVFSTSAYEYLFAHGTTIFGAYGISVLVTVVGTTVSLCLTAFMAYPLSRKDYPYRKVLTFMVVLTMLFNGGLVPTYFVYTRFLHFRNNILGLIVPNLLMSGFNVMIMKSFFTQNVPMEVIESAKMDGAGELRTFLQIVLPLSMPIVATVGLLVGINYWNDWYNSMIYITQPRLYGIQALLNQMLQDIQFLSTNAAVSGRGSTTAIPAATVRMAIAVVGSLPIMIVYPFFQKYFEKGITLGAVKG